MNPKEKLHMVPPVPLMLKRKRQRPETPSSLWWKSRDVTEEEWEAVPKEQQAPPEVKEPKVKDPPKVKPLKVAKPPRSRVGRVQVRLFPQIRKNRIRKVKTAQLRVDNVDVAAGILSRVVHSGKLHGPYVVHVKS
jgi:hypothetical protein